MSFTERSTPSVHRRRATCLPAFRKPKPPGSLLYKAATQLAERRPGQQRSALSLHAYFDELCPRLPRPLAFSTPSISKMEAATRFMALVLMKQPARLLR